MEKKSKVSLDKEDEVQYLGDYEIHEVIGKGSYALVKLIVDKSTKEKYAVKIYKKESLNDSVKKKNLKKEIKILSIVKHKNILQLYKVITGRLNIYIVTEYVSRVSLLSFLEAEVNLEEEFCKFIFSQIVSAVNHLHQNEIIHRDLKLQNILLDENLLIKIIDFGFSRFQPKDKIQVYCGTPTYMAPEILRHKSYDPRPTDIWALGIILFRMLVGEFPFRAKNQKKLF